MIINCPTILLVARFSGFLVEEVGMNFLVAELLSE